MRTITVLLLIGFSLITQSNVSAADWKYINSTTAGTGGIVITTYVDEESIVGNTEVKTVWVKNTLGTPACVNGICGIGSVGLIKFKRNEYCDIASFSLLDNGVALPDKVECKMQAIPKGSITDTLKNYIFSR